MRGLFITGTDTGVGKTRVACAILRDLRAAGYRIGAYKPACSGARMTTQGQPVWDDVVELRTALGRAVADDVLAPQRFLAPLAPPVAAKQEGRSVDWNQLIHGLDEWRNECDVVVIEGAGGLLCPLTESASFADLALCLGYPLIVVARLGLGTINHTLLTVEVAQLRGLRVAGIVLNDAAGVADLDASARTNAEEIAGRCDVPVLGILGHNAANWVGRIGEPVALNWATFAEPPTAHTHNGSIVRLN